MMFFNTIIVVGRITMRPFVTQNNIISNNIKTRETIILEYIVTLIKLHILTQSISSLLKASTKRNTTTSPNRAKAVSLYQLITLTSTSMVAMETTFAELIVYKYSS